MLLLLLLLLLTSYRDKTIAFRDIVAYIDCIVHMHIAIKTSTFEVRSYILIHFALLRKEMKDLSRCEKYKFDAN